MGGVGRYQASLKALDAHGFDVFVLLPESDVGILPSSSDYFTFKRPGRGLASLYNMIVAMRSARRRCEPDLYFFNSTFALIPLLFARLMGDRTPSVYCAHSWAISNHMPNSIKGRLIRAFEGNLCGLSDLVVNVSNGDAQIAKRFGYRGRHKVIENAVADTDHSKAQDNTIREHHASIRLLFVGRFDHQKGLDLLLLAFARARRRNPKLCLSLIGGPVRNGRVPKLPAGVTHHGWVPPDKLDQHYQSADLLVVPSRWEGLPLVIPEALRNGTPVLVSDRSNLDDLIEEGVTGDVFALDAHVLEEYLASLTLIRLLKMRSAARASYEQRFTLERFVGEMSACLRNLSERTVR